MRPPEGSPRQRPGTWQRSAETGWDSDARRRMEAYPYELSGGMCQRVIIAMSVCSKPQMIIADEPTTALDVTVQAQVLDLLKELRDKYGTAILLITHNLGVVWDMCDSVIVMYAGKTVEYAPCIDLYNHPLHPYTWGLLDCMPRLSSNSKEELSTIAGTPPDLRLTGVGCNFANRCPYAQERCRTEVPELTEVSLYVERVKAVGYETGWVEAVGNRKLVLDHILYTVGT